MKKIFLIGFMGSGKTTLGKKIASHLHLEFIDMDDYIEQKEGRSISSIFEKEGEAHFRALEQEALNELLSKENVVVSTGGGTPCFYNNMELINASAQSVYLQVEPEMLLGRLKGATNKRPLLANLSNEELRLQISEKLAAREPYYMQSKVVHPSKGSPNKDLADLVAILSH
ncbi:MAG: shikimate kinase [Flavobacteriales bacterium]